MPIEDGPNGHEGPGTESDHEGEHESDHDDDRARESDHDSLHDSPGKDSSPELGHFAEAFARDAADRLDRLARETGNSDFERGAAEERERYLDLNANNPGATEYHLLSMGGDGMRNDYAGLDLAWVAQSYVGSTTWKAQNGQTYCNLFVNSMGVQAGLQMPSTGNMPANTQGWVANTGSVRCWKETQDAQKGDVFVFNDPNATKGSANHMGIVTDPDENKAVSAGSTKVNEYTSWEYDSEGQARYVEHAKDANDLSGRADVHFYEYTCPDHRPFEMQRRFQ
jgi:hypothetical protein